MWTHEDTQQLYDEVMAKLKSKLTDEDITVRDLATIVARLQAEGIESRTVRDTAKRNLKLPDIDDASYQVRAQG